MTVGRRDGNPGGFEQTDYGKKKTSMLGRTLGPTRHRRLLARRGQLPASQSLPLLLGRALLVERVARPIAAVAVVGHTLGAVFPIRMLPLVERAARAIAAVAVVGHALRDRLLLRHGG